MKTENLLRKGKFMVSQVLLFGLLFSCGKADLNGSGMDSQVEGNRFQPAIAATIASSSSSNLIYEETFEGSNVFATYVKKQFITTYSFTVATSPVFHGSKSGRFELRDTDPLDNSGTRAEISFPQQANLNRWYAFSVYFPSASYKIDASDDVISQWHQMGNYSPSISLRTYLDRYKLVVKPTPTTTEKIDLGAIAKDRWNTFVFHIKHSSGSDGIIEVYLNGNKVVNRTGISMYDLSLSGVTPPKWKMGIYKSDWNGSQTTNTQLRILYYDNIRLGNENATYQDMASDNALLAPDTPAPINSFTLVSAHTEKDIMTIANGATISLSQISVPKLNLRANAAASVGSVKFEMNGAQSKTIVDDSMPYALHGDDGKGNYYFGSWAPPTLGTYTIKATTYSGANATGAVGTPYSITITFVK
jgi:hypothetical protein